MLMSIDEEPLAPLHDQILDYDRVRRALEFMTGRWCDQPTLDAVAAHVGLSPSHFHHLFRRFAGLTPKAFLQAMTLDQAKARLRANVSLFDAAHDVGLSGPSRLHDLFVSHEAMSPGEWKAGGGGLTLRYGFHPSPFGEAIAVMTDRGLAGLGWVDEKAAAGRAADSGKAAGGREGALADMRRRWPNARFVEDAAGTAPAVGRVFDPETWRPDRPIHVVMLGTDFEIRVWRALIAIPMGETLTYGALADRLGRPGAARAVGAAVGRNPVSFVVPCHRVVGSSGALTGYHWGVTRKRAILGWEMGRSAQG